MSLRLCLIPQRSADPRPSLPIHQKYNLRHPGGKHLLLDIERMREHMVHNDFVMLFEDDPPTSMFEDNYNEDYNLLSSKEFQVMMSNPSSLFTVCINEIFSDCESVHKSLRRQLPFCIDPYTKYPLHFNLYVTTTKNREIIKAAVFINATVRFQGEDVINRLWLKEIKFNLLPNHLKLYSLDLKNCKQDNSIVTIKNPTKNELQLLIQYRYKKFYLNNKEFDQKVTLPATKPFRFLIQARNATMTVFTFNPSNPQKTYPTLYLPLHCIEPVALEHVNIGIINQRNIAFTYPILLTSHTQTNLYIREIDLQSSSQTVELVKLPTHKLIVHASEKQVQIASFSVYPSAVPNFKCSLVITVRYSTPNGSFSGEISRQMTYSEHYNSVSVGNNRFFNVKELKKGSELTESQKIRYFNFSLTNFMQLPIRPELVNFDHQNFRMHWYRYTGMYLYPNRAKEQFLLQYTGPREIPISPLRYAATLDLNGGMMVPFDIVVYDNTLICVYQGRQDRCSKLRVINFGHQRSEEKSQEQTLTFKNLNPNPIKITYELTVTPVVDLSLNIQVSNPFPFYKNAVKNEGNKFSISLEPLHAINLTFQVKVTSNLVGDMLLNISTEYERITPKLKFHFESGSVAFAPSQLTIPQFDHVFRGELKLISTFHEEYFIKEIISNSNMLYFNVSDGVEYQRLQKVMVPFMYSPHIADSNITDQCCDQDWMKSFYLEQRDSLDQRGLDLKVSLITSSEMEATATIKIKGKWTSLLNHTERTLHKKVLLARKGSNVCFQVHNPYQLPLKYAIALVPNLIKSKASNYFTYFRYVKKQKVDTYFCTKSQGRNANFINPSSLRQLFRLEDKPTELIQKDGTFVYKTSLEQTNLSNNEYLNGFTQTGQEICYKFTSTLFFKLLIESEVVNDILERYPFEVIEKLVEKEYQYLMSSHFSTIFDDFYEKVKLDFSKYCSMSVYPIFRFCQVLPLKNLNPPPLHNQRKKPSYLDTRVIPVGSKHEQCYMLGAFPSSEISFHMVINNNYSLFDAYDVDLKLIEPRLQVGDISFEENHNINHSTFIKHYFPDLHNSLDQSQRLLQNGITSRHKIVPVYFTSQDYDEQFGIFKGSRYFDLLNQAPIDLSFTHYAFQPGSTQLTHQHFQIHQTKQPPGTFKIQANSKSTFKISFKLDNNFPLNGTNKLLHNKLTVYFYHGEDYYIQLHLTMKVADNILVRIRQKSEEVSFEGGSTAFYVCINFGSFGYICLVILVLKKEEEEKQGKMEQVKSKGEKIKVGANKPEHRGEATGQKDSKRMRILPPTSIGVRVQGEKSNYFQLSASVTEEDLLFFKTLKEKEDKSIIISQSSQSEHPIRLSQDQSERFKTDEDERSQKSLSGSKSEEVKQQSGQSSQNEEESQEEQESSEGSLTESVLPDGFSVCNQVLDIDDVDFQFGFEAEKVKKNEKKNNNEEYKWFDSHNPLKEEKKYEPFPWMKQPVTEKKKIRYKPRKEQ